MKAFRRLLTRPWFYIVTIVVVALATIGVMALGQNVVERRAEGERSYVQIVDLDEETVDPAVWGQNFPRQYEGYLRTVDTAQTKYGGSEAFSRLEADPRLLEIFAGYSFAIEYREERGHANSLVDQEVSKRVTEEGAARLVPALPRVDDADVLRAGRAGGRRAGGRPAVHVAGAARRRARRLRRGLCAPV